MDAREQITALREKLRYHNEKYYDEDFDSGLNH